MKQLKSLDGSVTINIPEIVSFPESPYSLDSGAEYYKTARDPLIYVKPEEAKLATNLVTLYSLMARGVYSPVIEFPNGYSLRWQASYGKIREFNSSTSVVDLYGEGELGWGLFPNNISSDSPSSVGCRILLSPVGLANFERFSYSSKINSKEPIDTIVPSPVAYLGYKGNSYYIMCASEAYNYGGIYNFWIYKGDIGPGRPDTSSPVSNATYVYFNSVIKQMLGEPTSPPGGGSTEGGGDGDFDNTTTTIPLPDLPIISLANMGIVKLYQIGQSDITNLSNFLWDTGFETLFTKWMQDPTEALISLRMCPVPPITETDPTQVYIGSVEALGVNGNLLTERYIEVDMGTLTIPPYWGNFLDYNPHTKVEVYIPYSGFQKLDTDIVMNSTINLRYRIDYLSGEAVAIILVDKGEENLQAPIYEFPVNIFSEIPLTSKSSDIYRNALQLIGASAIAGVGAAAGGATAAFALANAAASATNVVSSKETVQKVGGTGGSIGFMGVQTPYLIINRPEQSVPDDYNKFYGYPCNMWETLGNLEGYTVVERIHLENIIATSEELDLIEKELKSGVIL